MHLYANTEQQMLKSNNLINWELCKKGEELKSNNAKASYVWQIHISGLKSIKLLHSLSMYQTGYFHIKLSSQLSVLSYNLRSFHSLIFVTVWLCIYVCICVIGSRWVLVMLLMDWQNIRRNFLRAFWLIFIFAIKTMRKII